MNQYQCHDRKPFAETAEVQDGWTPDGRRVMKEIPAFGERGCVYATHYLGTTDPGCDGCSWREKANG